MAEEKRSKNRKKQLLPAADSFSKQDTSGWLFQLMHEGWLRKRWKKRYCVLSNGIIYSYEKQLSSGTEKTSSSINTQLFQDCIKAPRKDCKKSNCTFILEPGKPKAETAKNSSQAQNVIRELFYTETADELEMWVAALKESINLSNVGSHSTLKHITKSRVRPPRTNGGRRPPSKHHLKERITMSEIDNEIPSTQAKDPSTAKDFGRKPLVALKPGSTKEGNAHIIHGKSSQKAALPKPPPAALKPSAICTKNADEKNELQDERVEGSETSIEEVSNLQTNFEHDFSRVSCVRPDIPSYSLFGEVGRRSSLYNIKKEKFSPNGKIMRSKSMPVTLSHSEIAKFVR